MPPPCPRLPVGPFALITQRPNAVAAAATASSTLALPARPLRIEAGARSRGLAAAPLEFHETSFASPFAGSQPLHGCAAARRAFFQAGIAGCPKSKLHPASPTAGNLRIAARRNSSSRGSVSRRKKATQRVPSSRPPALSARSRLSNATGMRLSLTVRGPIVPEQLCRSLVPQGVDQWGDVLTQQAPVEVPNGVATARCPHPIDR